MTIKNEAIAEILSLIDTQKKQEDDGFTIRELKATLGYGYSKTSAIIDTLMAEGYLICLRIPRVNRAGVSTTVIGYKLTAKAQDKAAAQS